ncbi:hypothetical protein [Halosimplex halophilum]|uniref:hypothetical protein n=1 Tax=Halosimplex halophilum TaxID=2559572 RepID=UPI00107F474B|nr:hypothetical protein [Halosimplex halophilum]
MTDGERTPTGTPVQWLGGLWTVGVALVALASSNRGATATVVWWGVFPAAWLLGRRLRLAPGRRRALLTAWTLLGCALLCLGTWLAWPWYGPLHTGMRVPLEASPLAARGYQPADLPILSLAVGGTVGSLRYREGPTGALVPLAIGLVSFLSSIGVAWVVGGGLWVFSWGYNVTLGGSIGLVYAGLFGLASSE